MPSRKHGKTVKILVLLIVLPATFLQMQKIRSFSLQD
jgi:hypothetical protein